MQAKLNYYYFSFFFICLTLLHLHHLFLIPFGSTREQLFYVVDIVSQSFLETALLVLIAGYISTYLPKSMLHIFMLLSSILFLMHLVEFPLIRLMDVSIWFGIDFLLDESWENFLEMLYASNIPLTTWSMAAVGVILLFLLGISAYLISIRKSDRRPFFFSLRPMVYSCCVGLLLLSIWDAATRQYISPLCAEKCARALPWKSTLAASPKSILPLPVSLKKFHNQEFTEENAHRLTTTHQPDIFLFVIESLREDFLTPEIAPHLHRFKEENGISHLSYSNSNATQISWFSLFHARYPFYWGEAQKKEYFQGALPLQILKKMGYQMHVYSSSRLSFYQMQNVLFGENNQLLDTLNEQLSDSSRATWQCDETLFTLLNQAMLQPRSDQGRLFMIFLDSTHFDYSWPKEKQTLFTPIEDKIDFLHVSFFQKNLESIKNRYRNAIHYIDHLMGTFFANLPREAEQEPVVIITGDHGEEFFEEGHLFHASNLNEYQTRVPIYYNIPHLENRITSHIDIFPTLLHHVVGEDRFGEFFEGNSLLRREDNPFVIAGRYNASRSPSEFFIHNEKYKIRAQFTQKMRPLRYSHIQLLSCEGYQGAPPLDPEKVEKEFAPIIHKIFTTQ